MQRDMKRNLLNCHANIVESRLSRLRVHSLQIIIFTSNGPCIAIILSCHRFVVTVKYAWQFAVMILPCGILMSLYKVDFLRDFFEH